MELPVNVTTPLGMLSGPGQIAAEQDSSCELYWYYILLLLLLLL